MEEKTMPAQSKPNQPIPHQTIPAQPNLDQSLKTDNKITSIRVRTHTRDLLNSIAQKHNTSAEELILSLIKSASDNKKQILLTMDSGKYNNLCMLAKRLNEMQYTSSDRIEDMIMFALEHTTNNIIAYLSKIDAPVQPTGQNGTYGTMVGVER